VAKQILRGVSLANNEGTYGPSEAVRAVGTSEPAFTNSEIYIDDAGFVQYRGCRPSKAPGRFRFNKQIRFKLTKDQREQLKLIENS